MAEEELPTIEEALEMAGLLPGMMEYCEKKGLKRGLEQGKREAEQNIITLLKSGKSPEEIIQLMATN